MRDTIQKSVLIDTVFGEKKSEEFVDDWKVAISSTAKNCRNYIREIVDNLVLEPNPEKKVIALSIGDPTVYGNLGPAQEATEAVIQTIANEKCNTYGPCQGLDAAREAISSYYSNKNVVFKPEDIFLASGCSSALDLSINVLADGTRRHNIVIPKPGFLIYRTLAECTGIEVRFYDLIPEQNWEIDLIDLEAKIDENTAAIVVTNPSNPCGSVFAREHLKDILKLAESYKIPLIADEIYNNLVFPGEEFVSLAELSTSVPVLVCGGLAKRFLAPGWRTGWIAVHDPVCVLQDVRRGLDYLSKRTMGSNTVIQGAVRNILYGVPQETHDELIETLLETAVIAYEALKDVKGLTPFMPQGSMYMMIKVQAENFPFTDGLDFVQKLMEAESVFCLPGEAFGISGFMRIILTIPKELMVEACDRIKAFCTEHYMPHLV